MGHCATQATVHDPVYWLNEEARRWEPIQNHPTPGRFAFVTDKQWIAEALQNKKQASQRIFGG